MMVFLIRYFIKWVIQGWILARLAKRVRKWLVKKYNLEGRFKETVKNKKDPDWNKIKWYAELAGAIYKENDTIKKKFICYLSTFLLYTYPSPRDATVGRMPASA